MRTVAAISLWLALAASLWTAAALGAWAQSASQETVYKVEKLNAGLPDPPASLDRSTPQAVLESLMALAQERDFETAAHLLNLADVPEDKQREEGPVLARQLFDVVDRKVIIDWDNLSDRPDALDANAASDNAMGGKARRSILLWSLDLGRREVGMRLNRVQVGDAPPVWVFSEQSVDNVPALHALYGPSELEKRLPPLLRAPAFWDLMWWEVIGLPLVLIAALSAGYLAHYLLSLIAHRVQSRTGTDVIKATRAPVILSVFTAVIATFTQHFFVFSGRLDTVLSPLIAIGYVSSAFLLVVNVVDALLDRLIEFDQTDLSQIGKDGRRGLATTVAAARRGLIVIIVLVGGAIVLSSANVFRSFGFSLLASAGAITLILGFAAREVLGNIMASMQIAMNQSARIGDKVLFDDRLCHVERINFTFVQLRVWTGERLIVPVSEFVSEPFENWTLQEPALLRLVKLRLTNDADVEALRKEFYRLLDEIDEDDRGDPDDALVAVTDQDALGKEVTFGVPCANPNTAWLVSCQIREDLIKAGNQMMAEGKSVFASATPSEAT